MKKIAVMGGSFNPPTLAHEKLLDAVVDTLRADLGIFVPSSNKYVTRKMNKVKRDNQVYSEYEREHMLNIICDSHKNFTVDTCEFGDDGRGYTYRTLCEIQKKYPDAEIYFICGGDKLNIIPKWHSANDLLEQFHFAVTARKDDNPHEQIECNTVLNKYKDKFVIIEQPEDIDEISSTEARMLINKRSSKLYKICNKLVTEYIKELNYKGSASK